MEISNGGIPRGRVSQVFAAALGSFCMFLVNRTFESGLAGALIYFVPAVTLFMSGVLGELEDWIKDNWSEYREKATVDQFVVVCDNFLKDEGLDDTQREEIMAKKNQARMSVIDNKFLKLNKNAPTGTKIKPRNTRRVNKKAIDE
jgi:hypothetical protein